MKFNYQQPTELIFGAKKVNHLPNIVKRYGNRVLLVGPVMNEAIQPMFNQVINNLDENGIITTCYLEIEPNPLTSAVDKGLRLAKENNVDVIVAMGGGSSIDTAKMISLCIDCEIIDWQEMFKKYDNFANRYEKISKTDLPVIAISTTAGTGSQCTQASVITDDESKMKLTVFHQDNFVEVAILDPELTMTLPRSITVSTAFDAFTHAFESYLRNDGNPITENFSLQAIQNIVQNLPHVLIENKIEYREKLMLADTYAGIALANNGAALPHPLSEIIGSYVNKLSHGQALAMVYPTFVKHTYEKYQTKFATVCRIFDESYCDKDDAEAAKDFYKVLNKFEKENYLEFNLSQFDLEQSTIDKIKNCEIWQHLPMEKTETILEIVNEICKL
ncbi:iron-containing alcohol dehydrogenase [Anaerorhabdus sp.]|uniref:iron-containing alcohol dehydrogenase n=1 Tax=Anaerorhabdus sp. TaxID=1872524 RepID=UPI002FCAB72C